MGKVWVKYPGGRPIRMLCHRTPSYLDILKVKTWIHPFFLLLPLNRDIILSSSLTLIAVYTTASGHPSKVRLDIE